MPQGQPPRGASVAQLEERELPKLEAAGSKPTTRSVGNTGSNPVTSVQAPGLLAPLSGVVSPGRSQEVWSSGKTPARYAGGVYTAARQVANLEDRVQLSAPARTGGRGFKSLQGA